MEVKLPHRKDLKLLETFLLLGAMKLVNASRVFEFGTFLGSTTLNIALNLPADGKVFTFDLDRRDLADAEQHPSDAPLTVTHLANEKSLDFLQHPEACRKVTTLTGNSRTFDFSHWYGSMDLVFVDGGHDATTVKADTENAQKLIRQSGPACIMWHDYGNLPYPDVEVYLNELAAGHEIFHVEDTMMCVLFTDPTMIAKI